MKRRLLKWSQPGRYVNPLICHPGGLFTFYSTAPASVCLHLAAQIVLVLFVQILTGGE